MSLLSPPLCFIATVVVAFAASPFVLADEAIEDQFPVPDTAKIEPLALAEAQADAPEAMKSYNEIIEHTSETIEMLPIPGGTYWMGDDSIPDAAPRHRVKVDPFWMSQYEITWDEFDIWMSDLDLQARTVRKLTPTPRDDLADLLQISQPTPPYVDMTFGLGKSGYPAISMSQHAARSFCKWLTAKTGRYYRLPTEAEWEYACRAGTETAYSFGDDPELLDQYAWYEDNYNLGYEKIGTKKPNPWGLYDMHGNVAEWVLDEYTPDGYEVADPTVPLDNPLNVPQTLYPRTVRGGGWFSTPDQLRSASREGSSEDWIMQDPQSPVSIWYLTDAQHVGFRIVRPFAEPSFEEKQKLWDFSLPPMKERPLPLDPNR